MKRTSRSYPHRGFADLSGVSARESGVITQLIYPREGRRLHPRGLRFLMETRSSDAFVPPPPGAVFSPVSSNSAFTNGFHFRKNKPVTVPNLQISRKARLQSTYNISQMNQNDAIHHPGPIFRLLSKLFHPVCLIFYSYLLLISSAFKRVLLSA